MTSWIVSYKRPVLWITAAIAVGAYWDPQALNGPFIYDDVASIVNNGAVSAASIEEMAPWQNVFRCDFWGTPMELPQSNKSYRPITTLTFRWNMMLSHILQTAGKEDHTYYFHAINVWIHGINTGLVTETAAIVLGGGASTSRSSSASPLSLGAPIIAGILFGIHPVHAEAVSNIASRGELLMTFFFLLAFLSYVNHIPAPIISEEQDTRIEKHGNEMDTKRKTTGESPAKGEDKQSSTPKPSDQPSTKQPTPTDISESPAIINMICVYVVPCLCMALSLFSKEQGVTTLCTLVAFDFIRHHSSIKSFLTKVRQGDAYSWAFLKRAGVLALQTLVLAGWRYYLNGETKPDFIAEQNPAGFAADRTIRVFSVNWVYCLYIRDMVLPVYLAPDWSGDGIPLIESFSDHRIWIVCLLWASVFGCVYSLCVGPPPKAGAVRKDVRQVILISFFAFLFLPFLLSSNLLVTIGLAKGDRVIYLPLFGYCLLQGLLCKVVSEYYQRCGPQGVILVVGIYAFFLLQFWFLGLGTNERNLAWADEYTLWTKAVLVNPRSAHTRGNAGRLMTKKQEYVQAEVILRPLVNMPNGDPNNTFLYVVALSKLDRCKEAIPLIEIATSLLLKERKLGGTRYKPQMSFHTESSLVIARSFCSQDVIEKGKLIQQSLVVDPNNEFARKHFMSYIEKLSQLYMQMKQMKEAEAHLSPQDHMNMVAAEQQLAAMREQMLQIIQQQNPPPNSEEQQRMKMQQMQQMMQQMQQQQQHPGMPQNQEQMQAMLQMMQMQQQQQQQQQQGMPTNQYQKCSSKRHKKCSIEPWTGTEQKERIERKAANKIEH
eukprot:scaffold84480_cov51-Attheya_sp.AAC.2